MIGPPAATMPSLSHCAELVMGSRNSDECSRQHQRSPPLGVTGKAEGLHVPASHLPTLPSCGATRLGWVRGTHCLGRGQCRLLLGWTRGGPSKVRIPPLFKPPRPRIPRRAGTLRARVFPNLGRVRGAGRSTPPSLRRRLGETHYLAFSPEQTPPCVTAASATFLRPPLVERD